MVICSSFRNSLMHQVCANTDRSKEPILHSAGQTDQSKSFPQRPAMSSNSSVKSLRPHKALIQTYLDRQGTLIALVGG
jgi:hypothetical protein